MERLLSLTSKTFMRGAALFLGTVALVVPSVRTALEEYASLTVTRFAAESPFSEIILASIGIVAVLLLLLTRQRNPQRPVVYRVRREMRGPSVADLATRFQHGTRSVSRKSLPIGKPRSHWGATSRRWNVSIGWLLRLRRIVACQIGARLS
ncbi:MAG TPA: hypothetical protein VGS58_03925 [Candidatus Sulfopaludibacter sp.]|nr:hypothetical protein [Candidatus Sulfopaludibacter sp.]